MIKVYEDRQCREIIGAVEYNNNLDYCVGTNM